MASKAKIRWFLKTRSHQDLGQATFTFDCSKATLLFNIRRGRNTFRLTKDKPFEPAIINSAYAYCVNQNLLLENIYIVWDILQPHDFTGEPHLTYLEDDYPKEYIHLPLNELRRPSLSIDGLTLNDFQQVHLMLNQTDDNDHFDHRIRDLSLGIPSIINFCWLTQTSQLTVGQFKSGLIKHFHITRYKSESFPTIINFEPECTEEMFNNIFAQHQADEILHYTQTLTHSCHSGLCLLQWISDETETTQSFHSTDKLQILLECYIRHFIDYYYLSSCSNRAEPLCEDILYNVNSNKITHFLGLLHSLRTKRASDPTSLGIRNSIQNGIELKLLTRDDN